VTAIDVREWVQGHRRLIDEGRAGPLVDDELRALIVVGRGPRRDYHVNEVAELFFQIEGDITVIIRDGPSTHQVFVPAGALWLAPAGVPHSPQRPVGTIGLVVERRRGPGMTEAFRWFCERCDAVVHEIGGAPVDPVDLRRSIQAFYADESARTCRSCGEVLRRPGP